MYIKGKTQPDARTSGRVQSEHNLEPGHVKRGGRREETGAANQDRAPEPRDWVL